MGELRIGWLNGWIYSGVFMAVSLSAYVFARRMTSFAWMSRRQLVIAGMADVITTGLCILTIWKPIVYPGVLFWTGNLLYALGLIIEVLSIPAFATTPSDKPVTKGIYAVLRHPYYTGGYLCLIGIGLICMDLHPRGRRGEHHSGLLVRQVGRAAPAGDVWTCLHQQAQSG